MARLTAKQYFEAVDLCELDISHDSSVFLFGIFLFSENKHTKRKAVKTLAEIKTPLRLINKLLDVFGVKEQFVECLREAEERNGKEKLRHQQRRHEQRSEFSLTKQEWEEALNYFDNSCAYCGVSGKMTFDHFIPISKEGAFTKGNVIPACGKCNSSKNNHPYKEWYSKQEFYDAFKHNKIMDFIGN